jgi:UDP-3-O-[3-hydroxymyristoyl] glucosamine N-acyltransferase
MTIQEIAELVHGELIGDGSIEIRSVASLDSAGEGQLAFVEAPTDDLKTAASCVLIPSDHVGSVSSTHIRVRSPKLAFVRAADELRTDKWPKGFSETSFIHETAHVSADLIGQFVSIGENAYVGEGCVIYDGVRIGSNAVIRKFTTIHPNSVIYPDVEVGYDCVIHGGVVIGGPGFGYVKDEAGEYHQFPQIGKVIIGDGVEIGANTCIDRGALGDTTIGDGTKIDNLVQIGHNVQIGKRVVIAAQTGISGSTVIEDDCVIGGQVGFGDHARVQSGAVIGSQAGVLPGKIVRPGVWWGTPIQPLENFKRQNAHIKGIGRMKEELRTIKQDLSKLKASDRT